MKFLITAICLLALITPFLASETNAEETKGHLLLGVDCAGQLTVPKFEAQFDISKSVLELFWEVDILQLQVPLCDFKEKGCLSKFQFNVAHEEIYTIEVHLRACPNTQRPEALFICTGDACSKILTPCESASDCGVGLHCPQEQRNSQGNYLSELMSELFSKIIFPDSNPTSTWRFCRNSNFNSSIVRIDEQFDSPSAYFSNRSQLVELEDTDAPSIDYTSNITILSVYCNGRIDLFGRSHNFGLLQRAVQTVQELPPGFLHNGMDLLYKSHEFLMAINEFSALQRFLGLKARSKDKTKWAIYSRLLNETLMIAKANQCEALTDVLIEVQLPPGIYQLLSIKGCSYHIECPSVLCVPPNPPMSTEGKNGILMIRAMYGIEPKHKGICSPWSIGNITRWTDSGLMDRLVSAIPTMEKMFNPNKREFNDLREDATGWSIYGILNTIIWLIGLLTIIVVLGTCISEAKK